MRCAAGFVIGVLRDAAGLLMGLPGLCGAAVLFLLIAFLLGVLPIYRFGVGRAIFGERRQVRIRKNGNFNAGDAGVLKLSCAVMHRNANRDRMFPSC